MLSQDWLPYCSAFKLLLKMVIESSNKLWSKGVLFLFLIVSIFNLFLNMATVVLVRENYVLDFLWMTWNDQLAF